MPVLVQIFTLSFCLNTLWAATLVADPQDQAEFRTWRDESGKFSVDAKLLEVADGQVQLEKKTGEIIRVPVGKLSNQDRKFLDQSSQRSFGESPPESPPESPQKVATDVLRQKIRVSDQLEWQLPAQSRPLLDLPQPNPIKFRYWDDSTDPAFRTLFFASVALVRNSRSSKWLVYDTRRHGVGPASGFYDGYAFDMTTSESLGEFRQAPFSAKANVLSSDQRRMLFLSIPAGIWGDYSASLFQRYGRETRERLTLKLPKDRVLGHTRDQPHLQFAGPDHFLVTTTRAGQRLTSCCRISDAELIWTVNHKNGCWPLVTPDQTMMIVGVDNGLVALDVSTGEQVAWTDKGRRGSYGTLSVSPDGRRLIEVSSGLVVVYDFETGRYLYDFGVLRGSYGHPYSSTSIVLEWIDENRFAIVNRNRVTSCISCLTVVDLTLQTALCHYHFREKICGGIDAAGRLRYLVAEDENLVWRSMSLPHAAVAEQIARNAEDLLTLDVATSISVTADWVARLTRYCKVETDDPAKPDRFYSVTKHVQLGREIAEIMRDKFQERGFEVHSQGAIRLSTKTAEGDIEAPFSPRKPDIPEIPRTGAKTGASGQSVMRPDAKKRSQIDPIQYVAVDELPEGAIVTGYAYASKTGFDPLTVDGFPVWRPYRIELDPRGVADPEHPLGFRYKDPEEIFLGTIRNIELPSRFVRPRQLPTFQVSNDEIKPVRDYAIDPK